MVEINLNDWKFCKKIQTNPEMVAGNKPFQDFVSLLSHQSLDLTNHSRKDLRDIIFVNEDRDQVLEHQVKFWDSQSGLLKVNLLLPVLHADKPTTVYLYYGNPSFDTERDSSKVWKNYADQRTFAQNPLEEDSTLKKGGFIDFHEFQILHKKLLEELFGKEWFTKNVSCKKLNHPAYGEWLLCQKKAETLNFAEIVRLMVLYSKNYWLISITRGNLSDLSIGELSNYGDQDVVSRVKSTIVDTDLYDSTLSEIAFASALISRKYQVTATEETGLPDFKVSTPTDAVISVEIKRLDRNSSFGTIQRAVKKANSQHKRFIARKNGGKSLPTVTVLFFEDEEIRTTPLTDEFPMDITSKIEGVKRLLDGAYSNTTCITICWNDLSALGMDDAKASKIIINLKRRSHTIDNKKTHGKLPKDKGFLDVSETRQLFVDKS